MSDELKKPEKKQESFIKVTWQQVVSVAVGAIFLGILGWMGATIKVGLEDVTDLKEWKTATETLLNTDLAHTIENLDEAIQSNSSKMGLMTGDIRRLEILVNRLDVIVDRIDSE